MKKIVLFGLVAMVSCFLSFGSLKAADEEAKSEAAKKAQARAEEAFKKLDADADGKLTADEFRAKKKDAAAKISDEVFKLIDQDGNGTVCIVEFSKKPAEAIFKTTDKDQDGTLTLEEFKAARKQQPDVEEAFKKIDADGDGKVTLDEFKKARPAAKAPAGAKKAGAKGGKKAAE
jgi:Ca2+-binding EF-hand superfamily protein